MSEERTDLKSLDVRITELENAVKKLADSVEQVEQLLKPETEGRAAALGQATICSVCQVCQTCQICRICQICQVCRVCRICNVCYECSCGPCSI